MAVGSPSAPPRSLKALAARLAASPLLLAFLLAGPAGPAPVSATPRQATAAVAPASSAEVVEILDGDQLYIDTRRAHLRQRALSPKQVRTEGSRGQLRFDTGASGRLNRFSRIRLGSTCFLLTHGEVLISGRQSGCTRSRANLTSSRPNASASRRPGSRRPSSSRPEHLADSVGGAGTLVRAEA